MENQPNMHTEELLPVEQWGQPELELAPNTMQESVAEAAPVDASAELPEDPLAAAQRRNRERGLPVSRCIGKIASRYSAVDPQFGSVDGYTGGGMGYVSL